MCRCRHFTFLTLFFTVYAFHISHFDLSFHRRSNLLHATSDWIDITELHDQGVRFREQDSTADTTISTNNCNVLVLQYKGTIAPSNWNVDETIKCWLNEQQGLSDIAGAFQEHNINEETLIDTDLFNEGFVTNKLGVLAKIKAKKLVMAAKRLHTVRLEYTPGLEFDFRESYEVPMDGSKLIKGMTMGLAYMVEKNCFCAEILCRCDYAYGAEGYRKANGDVLVPPFASLHFDVIILDAH